MRSYECPFCAEFDGDGLSIFASMLGERLSSRVVYEDKDFIVMPPLGEFIEGGLLVLTREHMLSMAHLRSEQFDLLERLVSVIGEALRKHWGVAPLVFEHGPAPLAGKGVCCVDHAHLNIFPAKVRVHPHLLERRHKQVSGLADLAQLKKQEYGYLFVQENDGTRHTYDGRDVPTQLVRRIIATQLGIPERWHWREYPGCSELLATCAALKGEIRM
jgi:diadenosine tetraphosphate (Ap4A) HIT family hydrolase